MTTYKLAGLGLLSFGLVSALTACFGDGKNECDTAMGPCDTDETDADADSDADSDTDSDADADPFEAYVYGIDLITAYDGEGLKEYGFGDETQQDPFAYITFFEEAYWDTGGDERHTCVDVYEVQEVKIDGLGIEDIWTGFQVKYEFMGEGDRPCDEMDEDLWGDTTPADVLAAATVGAGFGPFSADFESALKSAVQQAGLNWDEDWEPYSKGFYPAVYDPGTGSLASANMGYFFAYELDEDYNIVYNADDELVGVDLSGLDALPEQSLISARTYYLVDVQTLF